MAAVVPQAIVKPRAAAVAGGMPMAVAGTAAAVAPFWTAHIVWVEGEDSLATAWIFKKCLFLMYIFDFLVLLNYEGGLLNKKSRTKVVE